MQFGRGNKSHTKRKQTYLGNREWRDLAKRYSIAQLDYPEGIGIYRVINVKEDMVGYTPLCEIPPVKMKELINECITEYNRLKRKEDRGERIEPDIMCPRKQKLATIRARSKRI